MGGGRGRRWRCERQLVVRCFFFFLAREICLEGGRKHPLMGVSFKQICNDLKLGGLLRLKCFVMEMDLFHSRIYLRRLKCGFVLEIIFLNYIFVWDFIEYWFCLEGNFWRNILRVENAFYCFECKFWTEFIIF